MLAGHSILVGCAAKDEKETAVGLREKIIGSRASRHQKYRAFSDAVRKCVKTDGFSYPDVDPVATGSVVLAPPPGLFIDPIELQTYGYGLTRQKVEDPVFDYTMTLSSEQRTVFLKSWQRCMQEKASITVVNIPEETSARLAKSLKSANADYRVVEMQRQWQRCMAAEGFPFETSAAVRDHLITQMSELPRQSGTGVPSQREVDDANRSESSVALVDSQCTKPLYRAYQEILLSYDRT